MSFNILHELALQLYSFKNIDMKHQGAYFLRFHLYYTDKMNNKIIFSTPTSIIESGKKKRGGENKRSEIIDNMYLTEEISIQYEDECIVIDEMCVFRTSIDTSITQEQIKLTLFCELLIMNYFENEQGNLKRCCSFEAEIKNSHCSEYLQIQFDDKFACTIIGSVHAISYKTEFKSNEERIKRQKQLALQKNAKIHIKDFNENQNGEEIIYRNLEEYMKLTQKDNQKILEYYLELIQEQLVFIEVLYREYCKLMETNKEELKILETDIFRFKECLEEEKGRRKIFEMGIVKGFEMRMHKLGNRIYHIWGNVIQIVSRISIVLLRELAKNYQYKIKEKYGECLIRHQTKANWATEKYENSGEDHVLMSRKVRNTVVEDEIGLNLIDKSIFPDLKLRPIIFEEVYIKPYEEQEKITSPKLKHQGCHLIVYVHGFGACRYDMEMIMEQIQRKITNVLPLISISNEGKTESDIMLMGERLAQQVINYLNVNKTKQIQRISFIGHSMGGIIIRVALPRLEQYKNKFHLYMSLSSPHAGYLYNPSKLIDAGLWLINNVQKSLSIFQLTMQDNQKIEETFIYRLSQSRGFQWFAKMALVSSYQDSYVPYESARITKTKQTQADEKNGSEKGKRYNQIIEGIISRITASKLYRIDVNFQIPQKNIDKLIGRAAHLKFINSKQFLKMFITNCQHLFLP